MINWERRSYSKEEFIAAWEQAQSYSSVMSSLNLNKSGGSLRIVKETALELGLTTDHFATILGDKVKRYTLEEILVKDSSFVSTVNLKKRLYKAGLKNKECEQCNLTEWMGQPIPLSLDHINGDNKDNRIENLRILCMNCHALTETWCGKNKVRKASHGFYPGENNKKYFCECGKQIEKSNKCCRDCYSKVSHEKQNYPDTQVMVTSVEDLGYAAYARQLNISGNGLKKLLIRRGVNPLPKKKKRL